MKILIALTTLFIISLPAKKCNEKKDGTNIYKGKLEIKALCMNYTIRLVEGTMW